jgi:predicted metallo-beta-lactamase superfamily hydrolase
MIGGPPFYLSSFKVDEMQLQAGVGNLAEIAANVPLTIVEHHTLRDEKWQQKTRQVYDAAAKAGHVVMTAAEFAGQENTFLEFNRKRLYADYPPSREFKRWMREGSTAKSAGKPPL